MWTEFGPIISGQGDPHKHARPHGAGVGREGSRLQAEASDPALPALQNPKFESHLFGNYESIFVKMEMCSLIHEF